MVHNLQDGCWGCFDEAQSLNQKALSVLLDHVQSIFQAMRARQSYMYLVDGTEVGEQKYSITTFVYGSDLYIVLYENVMFDKYLEELYVHIYIKDWI